MNKSEQLIKEIIIESVLNTMNEATWPEVEAKIDKWFKLSPGLTGNIKSVEVVRSGATRKDIVLHDKRGNKVALVKGASTEFVEKYLPILGNLLMTISGQSAESKGSDIISFK